MPNIRQQLSMYLPEDAAKELEEVRSLVDPVQHRLIPAHITLCREDELGEPSALAHRLQGLRFTPFTLRFGRPEAFSGHGWLLPCIEGEDEFRRLRERVLRSSNLREQRPHITLAHPRNPKAAGNNEENLSRLPARLEFTLSTIYWIEQTDGGPWTTVFRGAPRGA